ncbi:hypothetical protein BJ138DRAFT_1156898 [Hygrophoropsis aurantiaca]|uniref:Uncharacterized protein n=1 Tax=Hygrophoropsis aurantiaca TaxID=72124 RepID=A0ACB8A6V3_9AGAM|nr:hypothetical protein BJ138DRAFT_1156898 [Hygrophoropsis aurantiaca]
MSPPDDGHDSNERLLRSATEAFDHIFCNDLEAAQKAFKEEEDSPLHLLGLGVSAFLQAALGMEPEQIAKAGEWLKASEAGARKQMKAAKSAPSVTRFQAGMEWEIVHVDAVVLLGLINALSESYKGYLQCLYSLNSAHSKFSKLFKTVYPNGLGAYSTPSTSPSPSRKGSNGSVRATALKDDIQSSSSNNSPTSNGQSSASNVNMSSPSSPQSLLSVPSFFSRWPFAGPAAPTVGTISDDAVGLWEDLILSGSAFGFGLFNLIFSLLPTKVRGVVGFFGFRHDKKLALQALSVSAARTDVHSVFAGLVLMTYHGVVLTFSGYQADEAHILKQYQAMVAKAMERYPGGTLWILNKAKIQRITGDTGDAIETLKTGLLCPSTTKFSQAHSMLNFELAWALLAHRQHQEAAEIFQSIVRLNSWSHATYHFIAAGCYFSMEKYDKAQEVMDSIPVLLKKKKARNLPSEVYIKRKLAFYKNKQLRRGGDEARFVEAMKISPAHEIGIFWNNHARASKEVAQANIKEWSSLSPPVNVQSPYMASPSQTSSSGSSLPDLDTEDELAIRSLLLGIVHRGLGEYTAARALLIDAQTHGDAAEISRWAAGVALFELAVLDLKEAETEFGQPIYLELSEAQLREKWEPVMAAAIQRLDLAFPYMADSSDLSSRFDSRINMLKEEIGLKREMLGMAPMVPPR